MGRVVPLKQFFSQIWKQTLLASLMLVILFVVATLFGVDESPLIGLKQIWDKLGVTLFLLAILFVYFCLGYVSLIYFLASSTLISPRYGRFSLILCLGVLIAFMSGYFHVPGTNDKSEYWFFQYVINPIASSCIVYMCLATIQGVVMFIIGEKDA